MRVFLAALALLSPACLLAAEAKPTLPDFPAIDPSSAAWKELATAFAREPDGKATFEERRLFGFKPKPVILKGESFLSLSRGLSLHYTEPEERTVIIDAKGMIIREKNREKAVPAEPRIAAANAALLHILRFDLGSLTNDFDLRGEIGPDGWKLLLTPRSKTMQQAYQSIQVTGAGTNVARIELHQTPRNSIEILLVKNGAPTAEEMQRFFR